MMIKEIPMRLQKNLALLATTTATVLLSSAAFAQDPPPPREASIALGYVGTTGNTDTATFNAEFLLTLRSAKWTHNMKAQALGSQQSSQTTAERYFLENKSDYNLDEMQYLFGKASYLDDRFSGYSYQATGSVGYGRYLIKNDTFSLQAFGGVGYRQVEIVNGDSNGEAIVTVGEKLEWVISDSSKLVQSFTSDIGSDLTLSIFELGLESQIVDRIATKIAFQARNISDVPVGRKKTDTQTSISLVYAF
jgi:putative salt-induced outer membrane protein